MIDLEIHIEETKTTTSTFSYHFTDIKGVCVRVEGFDSKDAMEKDVKKKMKVLKNYKPIYK